MPYYENAEAEKYIKTWIYSGINRSAVVKWFEWHKWLFTISMTINYVRVSECVCVCVNV